jgi:hypothetical protein
MRRALLLLLFCSSCFAQKVVAVRIGKLWDGEMSLTVRWC